MIIDSHSHVGHDGETGLGSQLANAWHDVPQWKDPSRTWAASDLNVDPDHLIASMDAAGVDKAIVWGCYSKPNSADLEPAELAEIVALYPDRLIPYHVEDPLGGQSAVERLTRAVKEHGCRGMKLHPSYNNMRPDDFRTVPLYRRAAELGIPVVIHMNIPTFRVTTMWDTDVRHVEGVAKAFPDLRIVVAHCGTPEWRDYISLMMMCPNVYSDLASVTIFPIDNLADIVRWAKQTDVLRKVFFGSDYPICEPRAAIELLRRVPEYVRSHALEPEVTEADIAMVLGGNAERFLAL